MQSLLSNKPPFQVEKEIALLEKKYQQELKSGAVFHVLKSIRAEIRLLKNDLLNNSTKAPTFARASQPKLLL